MNTQHIKKTLAALALGSLSLMATGTQAENIRINFGYGENGYANRDRDYDQPHPHRMNYQQSQRFRQQIDARQERLLDRIQEAKHSGDLTRYEFRELMRDQRNLSDLERGFVADGLMDPREFHRLSDGLKQANRTLREKEHDHEASNSYGGDSYGRVRNPYY